MSLPLEIASSIRRTELSRATASGMNEFGNRTVSRSGRIGSSSGSAIGRSPVENSSRSRVSSRSLIAEYLHEPARPVFGPLGRQQDIRDGGRGWFVNAPATLRFGVGG